ncbi:uncharacterized protein E0L32_009134 [Thyridium curvatum]|uniref:Uncharacterized protein n=1 Tax=Thyridium curvatum TaxID=1093900 RepID=A0A507AXL0_9PEZI|nr:uncharacterized protein E0L32_009134 [Thyridium curvatum]TPX09661.1 hypothetical protein E0L32_009134 [Thyridium curvatum]
MAAPPPSAPGGPAASPSVIPTTAEEAAKLPYHGTPAWLHNFALAATVLGPVGMLLPPRRADFKLVILTSGTFWGTSQLAYDYTGRSINQRFTDRFARWTDGGLPEAARKNQALMQAEKARRAAAAAAASAAQQQQTGAAATPAQQQQQDGSSSPSPVTDALLQKGEEEKQGALTKLWMGGEKPGWKEARLAKEREAIEDGRGYWGLIVEQISDVVNWKGSDGQKRDEAAAKESEKKS